MSETVNTNEQVTRLTNRGAMLSLMSALFFFVGILSFGATLENTDDVAVRTVSASPFALATGSAIWARVTRSKLVFARREGELAESASGSPELVDPTAPTAASESSSPGDARS